MERVPQYFLMRVERVPHQNYFIFIGGAEMKKKNLKRIGSTVLVTTMALGLLAGCGGKSGDSANSTTKDANGATVISKRIL